MKPKTAERMAFDLLAMPQLENLCRTALWVVGSETEARDLVQESFVQAYYAWLDGRLGRDVRIGLFKILCSALKDRDRSCSTWTAGVDDRDAFDRLPVHSGPMNLRQVDESGRRPCLTVSGEGLRSAIQRVPGDSRLTVVLSLAEGFSYQEIAEITGVQMEAARTRLHQGRRLLQRELLGYAVCEGNTSMSIGGVRRSRMG